MQYADMHTCDYSDTKNTPRNTSSVILQVLLKLISLSWPANIITQNNDNFRHYWTILLNFSQNIWKVSLAITL